MAQSIDINDLVNPISELERECHESIAVKRRIGVKELTEHEAAALKRAKNILKTWVQINFYRQNDGRKDSLETRKFLIVLTEWMYIEADLKFFGL